MQTLFVPGPMPGLNDLLEANRYRGNKGAKGRRYNGYAEMKRQWGELVYFQIRRAKLVPMQKVLFRFTWIERDMRRDLDNVSAGGRKIILDSLVNAKIIKDDSWKYVAGWTDAFGIDTKAPGVLVEMVEESENFLP